MLIVSRATNISHCNVDPHHDPQSQTTYLKLVCSTNGLPQICLLAFSFGGVIGCSVAVFPNVTATRYAQQHFGYLGNTFCSTVDIRGNRMSPCYQGNQMAQNATSYSGKNVLLYYFIKHDKLSHTFLNNPSWPFEESFVFRYESNHRTIKRSTW